MGQQVVGTKTRLHSVLFGKDGGKRACPDPGSGAGPEEKQPYATRTTELGFRVVTTFFCGFSILQMRFEYSSRLLDLAEREDIVGRSECYTDVMSGMLVSVGGLGKAEDRFRAQCGSMPGKLAAALSVTPVSPTQGAKSVERKRDPRKTRLAITRAFRNFAAIAAAFASAAGAGAGAAAAAVATTAAAATAAARVFAVHSKPVPNELA
uniref:Uncharacterized protein n=1 Tax=Vespula pensylvanica TaxID=30213 RepID=A0A834PG04_VESPE|nr:hypothetical protein H0235_001404 [Vespula pensylvanica]